MVCLNNKLPIDLSLMKKVIISELENIIKNELYYILDKNEKIEKINNNIIKELKNRFNTDLFIQRIIHNENCIYKHKRGNKESQLCCKKITINGDKENFVCTKHNKKHIPKKRNINNNISIKKSISLFKENKINDIPLGGYLENKNGNEIVKLPGKNIINKFNFNNVNNISYNDREDTSSKDKPLKLNIINKNNFRIIKKINKNKINLNEIKRLKNKYEKNKSYSEKTICKYNNNNFCYNIEKYGNCNFKHVDRELDIKDLITSNNSILYFYI